MFDEQGHIQRLLNYAYFFLKFRPRTKKEVNDYLNKKSKKYHFSQEIITEVIKQLEEESLVNDKSFISWFVDQRSRSKPKSRFILTSELLRLGAKKDQVDQYFSEHEIDEYALASLAAQRKLRSLTHLSFEKQKEKLTSFLLRRGFSFEIIKQVIQK